MTHTTTELLASIRKHGSEALLDALVDLQELDQRLSSGEPLPHQWRTLNTGLVGPLDYTNKELYDEVRRLRQVCESYSATKVESDRDVVEAWWMAEEGRKVSLRHRRDAAVTLPCITLSHVWEISFIPVQFTGNTVDEAYQKAADWVRRRDG